MTGIPLVVVVAGSNGDSLVQLESQLSGETLSSALDAACGVEVESVLVGWRPTVGSEAAEVLGRTGNVSVGGNRASVFDRVIGRLDGGQLTRALARYPVGRLINSLSPTDPSRVFWRAARRDPVVMDLLARADVIVALDVPAVRTAWIRLQGRRGVRAYFGLQAAVREMRRARS